MIVLNAKTDYSFLRGFGTPDQWLARCKDVGVEAFGIADYCSTWGHTFFRKAFKGSGVKLIYGVQLPVVAHLDKDPRHSLVTLIAKDDLTPLYELVSKAHEQAYYRPRLKWDQVKSFPGFVLLDYVLPFHSRHAKESNGKNHYFNGPHQPAIAYGPRFPSPDLRQGYLLFKSISDGMSMGEVELDAHHLMREFEYNAVFGKPSDLALANTKWIADQCTADITRGTLIVPKVYKDKRAQLKKMAMAGWKKLSNGAMPTAYLQRLNRELDVIEEKKFEDYFFFVADIMDWAKTRMFVGPGRGSAGGSLLCYLLGITTVDPLKFNTMFERFIDITRPDLPDIDIDFPDTRREEVFEYLKKTYGAERVARLGTISEFGGKSAINDTAKATGVPIDVAREFGKYTEGVGQGVVISPARIFGTSKDNSMLGEDEYKLLEKYPQIRLAAMIDGHARHHGVHAAGVVVTQGNVTQHGSLTKEGVLAMDMRAAEEIGLVKMDALGLRTLSVIQDCCDLAGIDPRTLYDLDWEDTKVYDEIFNKDHVTGIFQFEGHAVRSLMKAIKVERFDDICALTSLARPGPLIGGAAEGWVKARRGDEEPRDLHPALESTYGVICYQEQMMAIVRDLAGFSEPEVNGMRRAVGKKDTEKLKGFRERFVTGVVEKNSGDLEFAESLWEELCEFGSYAFNLAHAVEYAMISFMTAWLKHKYPLQFAAACLRYAVDEDQGKNLLRELTEEGYRYVPFDLEKSQASWSIRDGVLFGGYNSVRGIGDKTAASLCATRDREGAGWLEALTASQRERLTKEHNTPWHSLTYFSEKYAQLYDKPGEFKRSYAKAGFRGPVLRIKDIPEVKGNFAFIGHIKRKQQRDLNEDARVAKRDGKVYEKDTYFINLTIEDDTGEIGGTVNRFKAQDFQWLLDQDTTNRDFFFRGNIIGEGRRWIFFDNIVELKGE